MKRDKLHIVGKNFRPQRVNIFDLGGDSHTFDYSAGNGSVHGSPMLDRSIHFLRGIDSSNSFRGRTEDVLKIKTSDVKDLANKSQDINFQKNFTPNDASFTQTNGSTAVVTPKQESKVPGLLESVRTVSSLAPILNIGSGLTQSASSAAAKEVAKAATTTAATSGIKVGTGAAKAGGEAVLKGTIGAEKAINGGVNAAGAASNAGKFASALGASKLGSLGSAGVGIAGSLVGMGANKLISEGYDTTAGNAVSDIGGTIGGVVGYFNPIIGAIVSAATGAIGGLVNRGFGMKTNEQAKASNMNAIAQNNAIAANAESLDDIQAPISGVSNVYEGGWFRGDDEDAMNAAEAEKVDYSKRNVENAMENLSENRLTDLLRHSYSDGGLMETMPAVDYDFTSQYLLSKKNKAEQNNNMNNIFGTPRGIFALGGDVQTHGSDFSTGLTRVDAGGSHESNPNDGVQMGIDSEGTPNLVEEGEAVFNDYVYSNRINLSKEAKEHFKFPKKKDITYAEAAKRLEKEASERPNDPISIAGLKAAMADLADAQEKQKAEMEAQRAKEAFEALSPEEQTAVMQNAAQQEAIAQQVAQEQAIAEQQAMQQPSPEEQAMMQQQMMQADGSQAMVGQEAPMMAEGGHLFKKGGKKNAGTWKKGSSKENWDKYSRNGLRDFLLKVNDELADAKTEEEKNKIREDAIKTVRGIQQAYSEAYQNNLTPSEVNEKVTALQKAFQNAGGNAYFGDIADNINLPKGHNTEDTEEKGWVDGLWGPRTSIRNWGSTEYGDDYDDIRELAQEAGLTYAPGQFKYGDNTLYELGMAQPDVAAVEEEPAWEVDYGDPNLGKPEEAAPTSQTTSPSDVERDIVPVHRKEWPRYAGLFGPAVGLGMQALGIGRPDTSGINAAISAANGPIAEADYKPLGNYMTYRPFDRLFYANQLNGRSLATDRMLMNTNSPSRSANLLANAYNTMLAQGNLYRQGEEYNDALEKQVAEFNRGTDQFNADAYNRTSQFNADARNRARQYGAQIALQGAAQKMDADAGWYNGLYGNVSGLFKGLGDIGRENAQWNMVSDMWADGLGGVATEETNSAKGHLKREKRSDGGKLKKKRGLTF